MKAIVFTQYGSPDVLQLKELKKPTPKDNEVLIRVHAATVTKGDCEMRSFDIPILFWLPLRLYMGIFKPRLEVLGQEFSGEVESVGKNVKLFKKGERIFGPAKMSSGAYREYVCLPADHTMAIAPASLSYEEAATIPTGGFNALHFVRKGNIKAGEKVLVIGAGGSIGTYAVQIAKSFGAEVTAVDSTKKLNMLRSIGADHVIDFTRQDFTRNSNSYDVIIDIVCKGSFSACVNTLKPNGRYIMGNPTLLGMIRGLWTSMTGDKKAKPALADYRTEDLLYLKDRFEKGQLKSVIDKTYPLELMAEAHRYVESDQKAGNVVVTIK